MKTSYQNRYGDNIVFEKIEDNSIKLSGYNPSWIRIGYENLYDKAYDKYCEDNNKPMSLNDFKEKIYNYEEGKNNPLNIYRSLVETDKNIISMFDPSGGPYIEINSNLKYYFNQKEDLIVKNIKVNDDHVKVK